jgi:predicted DNA-binding transcriptional regulator AlpA
MSHSILEELEGQFHGKIFLTMQDVVGLLGCSEGTVYNWVRRRNHKRRPPRVVVGREVRFPTKAFLNWLLTVQSDM